MTDLVRDRRWNWWIHVLEGGAYIGAAVAINANTVGTSMVKDLGGPAWAVALMPMATFIGFAVAPIFTAHHLDRLPRFLPLLCFSGIFQRLPFLIAAVMLWWAGSGGLSLWTVVLTPFISGFVGGLTLPGWQQLVAKTIPPQRRSSVFAARYVLSSLIGLGIGGVVTWALTRWPGTNGYAFLHLVAFSGAALSYLLFLTIREKAEPPPPLPDDHGFLANLRSLPKLITGDRNLSLYLITSVLVSGQFLLAGFLALHARQVLNAPDAYIGTLTMAQMVGAIVGNLAAALLGDRYGGKLLMILARALLLAASVGALFAISDWDFRLIFAAYGAALFVNQVGASTLSLELLPATRRSTILAGLGLVQVPSMILAAQAGAWLWHAEVSFTWTAGCTALLMLAALATVWPIHEPRHRRP